MTRVRVSKLAHIAPKNVRPGALCSSRRLERFTVDRPQFGTGPPVRRERPSIHLSRRVNIRRMRLWGHLDGVFHGGNSSDGWMDGWMDGWSGDPLKGPDRPSDTKCVVGACRCINPAYRSPVTVLYVCRSMSQTSVETPRRFPEPNKP